MLSSTYKQTCFLFFTNVVNCTFLHLLIFTKGRTNRAKENPPVFQIMVRLLLGQLRNYTLANILNLLSDKSRRMEELTSFLRERSCTRSWSWVYKPTTETCTYILIFYMKCSYTITWNEVFYSKLFIINYFYRWSYYRKSSLE